ncbi:uncharacterized protein A1O9_12120 [Exophiala aquamarina CBS 119918]|uniref:Uncharacterized protein n=1 Tax=Exophiala aquamarina CBS 119918 TaxID=1182545 RepID=A0A072NXQ9_9EURO|nr:uncharacterized protein A1O9_12120 [Exophiala aquamarina CBS 119918]KEF51783.1 hypothetical protein A1O9_12120 [Exophiala aquamarina CBS 119918]
MTSTFSLLRSIVLQPLIPAALLAASLGYPQAPQQAFLSQLTKGIVSTNLNTSTIHAALKVLLAVGLLYRANKYLEHLALNNYVTDKTWDWSREIVLVTGGSSGIGAAIVRQFAKRGVTVVVLDMAPPLPDSKTGGASPANTHFYHLDVTSSTAIKTVAAQIRSEIGSPTVVINNAGIGSGQLILDEGDEILERTIAINLLAPFRVTKEFLPDMVEKNHGHVVNVASMASFLAIAGNASYAATKVGLLAFHESLASELKSRYGAPKHRPPNVDTHTPHRATPSESAVEGIATDPAGAGGRGVRGSGTGVKGGERTVDPPAEPELRLDHPWLAPLAAE